MQGQSQSTHYGIVGNRTSSACVSSSGSIDWCCLPYLDSPSHFGAWIDKERGGHFQIAPQGDFRSKQRYLPNTNILETTFETPQGRATLTDWMPVQCESLTVPIFCRRIEILEGSIDWLLTCTPRFHYGTDQAQIESHPQGVVFRGNQIDDLALLTSKIPIEISANGLSAISKFSLSIGQIVQFNWIWGRYPNAIDNRFNSKADYFPLQPTLDFWRKSSHQCSEKGCIFSGPWHDIISRSHLVLQLLITPYSGSISQSVGISLSGTTPGTRTWGHRYASIRNCALNLQALVNLGCQKEAKFHFEWVSTIVERDGAEALQPIYTLDGGKTVKEREIPFLNRHERLQQFQLDIYGHVILAANEYFKFFGELPEPYWLKISEICEYVCHAWKRPDYGPWNSVIKPEHFVVSKLFCWVALEYACRIARGLRKPPPPRWLREKAILHQIICEQGFDASKNSFVRSFGNKEVDASCLWIPLLDFLPFDDPRVQGTLDTIRLELSEGSLLRYFQLPYQSHFEETKGDLWASCLFISCLALAGQVDEASDRLAETCTFANSLGLFSDHVSYYLGIGFEEFPSASVHLALVNAALYVGWARGHHKPAHCLIGESPRITAKSA